jgi:hemerythrin-like domain-containing protein
MKCTDLLMQEHKVILRILHVLEQMSRCIEKGEEVTQKDVQVLLGLLRMFADDHHQTMEESALFPELRRTASAQDGPLRHMLFEHDQERSLVEGLEDALHTQKGKEFVQFAERLVSLIRNHIFKEDNILFDIVERSLSSEQDEKVTQEFEKFRVDEGFLADLRRLEWKYLRKAA